jgi:cyclophilin family peptidyl-prolyl cis-trans isomerase
MFKKNVFLIILWVGLFVAGNSFAGNPQVLMKTTHGNMTIELYPDKAPVTVKNFLLYTRCEFYDDLLFHIIIKDFMIQGGGYYIQNDLPVHVPGNVPIVLESNNGLKNIKYTIAMARTNVPNSATSEFYINDADNAFLDYNTTAKPGYCVFGKVLFGTFTVDTIANVKTRTFHGMDDFPDANDLVLITDVSITTKGAWIASDFDNNGIVDFKDYAGFASQWRKTGSSLYANMDGVGQVTENDLMLFSNHWLEEAHWRLGDLTFDNKTNFIDYAILTRDWLKTGKRLLGDITGDKTVNNDDLIALAENWLQ